MFVSKDEDEAGSSEDDGRGPEDHMHSLRQHDILAMSSETSEVSSGVL